MEGPRAFSREELAAQDCIEERHVTMWNMIN
jgi:hypothetical protein